MEPLARLLHGSIECDGAKTTDYRCHVTCEDEYTLEGDDIVECEHGVWNEVPVCKPLCPPDDCSRHGTCMDPGVCNCWEGFKGDACQFPDCARTNQCSGHGLCVSTDVCLCDEGWDGPQCDLAVTSLDDIALQLTGPDSQAIVLPAMGEFGHVTVEAWVFVERSTLETGEHLLLENTRDVPGGVNLGVRDGHVILRADGVANLTVTSPLNVGWNHIAILCSPTRARAIVNSEVAGEVLLAAPRRWALPESRLGGGIKALPFLGLVKEMRVWNATRTWSEITSNAFSTVTIDPALVAHYPLSGPLSATASYLDDTTGRHPIRVLGGKWSVAPTAPPGPHLPQVYHSTPSE